ncbi:MAG: RNA methyltransferase [Syntrophomonadaceae bacterium]|nr:RNA methyltransferase [Syntrophomonadaceae bacterium]
MRRISSRDNSKIKNFIKLINNSKYRTREKMFVIEGRKMIREALECKNILLRLFIDESLVEDFQEEISLTDEDVDCCLLDKKLMNLLTDTEKTQGIAAVVQKPDYSFDSLLQNEELLVLLDRISDPGNLGTIIRTSWAFDVGGVLLTPGCVDPFSPKVVRSTMGGIFHMPVFENISLEDMGRLKKHGYNFTGTSMNTSQDYYSEELTGKKIIVIGNEARGISAEVRNVCQNFVKIPINYRVDSLNAAVACGIIIAEARKQKKGSSLS